MFVLGIETSCDETSAAIVENGRTILSLVTASSLKFHQKYGGVIPEIASRMHAESIGLVVDDAIKQAGIDKKNIGLIAVTGEPGLVSSLLVGVSFAKALSLALGIPLVFVDHIKAHLYASFLEAGASINLPCIGLIVSGGHTSLFYVKDFKDMRLLGATRDDACGESFDKVAKMLGLGYPGGVAIENLVKDKPYNRTSFSCGKDVSGLDFSFSGIKTAVLYHIKGKRSGIWGKGQKRDVAASFQEAAVETLIEKSLAACRQKNVSTLVVGGGVAANELLRKRLRQVEMDEGIKVFIPGKALCTDNAAMIAGLGHQLFKKGCH